MIKLNFSIKINASRSRVWNILWADKTYRQWSSVFSAGSYAVTDWREGSKVQFLTPDGNGMLSSIVTNVPEEFMSFKHLASIREGREQAQDEDSQKWAGAMENYTLKEADGFTELKVDIDVSEDYLDIFNKAFPLALEMIKTLSEK